MKTIYATTLDTPYGIVEIQALDRAAITHVEDALGKPERSDELPDVDQVFRWLKTAARQFANS